MLSRRGFFGGLIATLAAPAIIRTPGLLMAVKPLPPFGFSFSTRDLTLVIEAFEERYLRPTAQKLADQLIEPTIYGTGPMALRNPADGLFHIGLRDLIEEPA